MGQGHYPIESGGRLRISYRFGQKELKILNGTINVDPSTLAAEPVITREEALEIYNKTAEIRKGWLPFLDLYKPHPHLMYCYLRDDDQGFPLIPYQYRLSWFIAHVGNQFIIDAITGEIIQNKYISSPERTTKEGFVYGKTYPNAITTGDVSVITNEPLKDIYVEAFVDGNHNHQYSGSDGEFSFTGSDINDFNSILMDTAFQVIKEDGLSIFPDSILELTV